MSFEWLGISFADVIGLSIAFVLGLASRSVGLPPLVGFLAAGFLLNTQGIANHELIQKLADLGITLLLFTVGLKINLGTLARPQVWAVTSIHTVLVTSLFALLIYALVIAGLPTVADLDFRSSLLIAFALSFSSTVFVVKALEEKGEMKSLQGRIAIGILIMQDIAAVLFLAISTAKLPSAYALLLLLLIPARRFLNQILQFVGRGELLILYGILLAIGGAKIFELVGMKGDLGALVLGLMISTHSKADELAKSMLGLKDLFLLGFFLSIGLSGQLTYEVLFIALLITPLLSIKSFGFFRLLTQFKLRARTSLLTTVNLSNFSEFGLIVMAVGVSNGWIENKWLIIIAVSLSLSFVVSALLNAKVHHIYTRYHSGFLKFQTIERLDDDRLLDTGDAAIAIIGMGGVGMSAYDEMRKLYGETVVGVDIDPATVSSHCNSGRNVLLGDPSDSDFWERIQEKHKLETVMLALPKVNTALEVIHQLNDVGFSGQIAATSKFSDEVQSLKEAGVSTVFNIYTEAGTGFARHVSERLNP